MQTSQVRTVYRMCRGLLVAVAISLLAQAAVLMADDTERGDLFPVLAELRNPARHPLEAMYLEAITDGLRRVASDTGVVLCYEEGSGSTDPAFQDVCHDGDGKKSKIQFLRWNAQVTAAASEGPQRILIVTLSMDVAVGGKRKNRAKHWPEASVLIAQTEALVPDGSSAERQSLVQSKALYDLIVEKEEIYEWFAALKSYPALLLPRPEGEFPPPPPSRFADMEVPEPPPAVEAVDPMPRWEEEREAIVDLLLEDRIAEARDRAEALLGQDGLPEALARRVEELLSKAKAKIAAAEPADAIEPSAAVPPAVAESAPLDVTFAVRYAHSGNGFRTGVDGRLRISARDIRFVPSDPQQGNGWTVTWPTLKEAGEAAGVWDVAHPLVIETTKGEKYFITEITQVGRFGSGKSILEYIEKGRRGDRRPRMDTSTEPIVDLERGKSR